MRLALALAMVGATAVLAAEREVYQVSGKLAVLETETRPDAQGRPRLGATRFRMVLDSEGTGDYRLSAGSEFKPVFDEVVISSRVNVRPGYRDAAGDWLPLQDTAEPELGALVSKTLPGEGDRLEFFDFTGKLALRQDHEHPWAEPSGNFVIGELCLETAGFGDEGWAAPEGACDFLLVPE